MAYVVSFFGILAAVGIMLVSATMNARYAMSLGGEGVDKYLLAGGAVFADVGKALAWIYFATAVSKRQVLAAVSALMIFVLCLGLAVSGSLGFIACQ